MRNFVFVFVLTVLFSPCYAATGCGGTSQPRCEVNASVDAETTTKLDDTQSSVTAANTGLKGSLAGIADDKFKWTFIPDIPTTECRNPLLSDPQGTSTVEMDICGSFNTFQSFINGVLAFFCILGCVQQVRGALAVK